MALRVGNYLMRVSEGRPPGRGASGGVDSTGLSAATVVSVGTPTGCASGVATLAAGLPELANKGKAMPWPFSRA